MNKVDLTTLSTRSGNIYVLKIASLISLCSIILGLVITRDWISIPVFGISGFLAGVLYSIFSLAFMQKLANWIWRSSPEKSITFQATAAIFIMVSLWLSLQAYQIDQAGLIAICIVSFFWLCLHVEFRFVQAAGGTDKP